MSMMSYDALGGGGSETSLVGMNRAYKKWIRS